MSQDERTQQDILEDMLEELKKNQENLKDKLKDDLQPNLLQAMEMLHRQHEANARMLMEIVHQQHNVMVELSKHRTMNTNEVGPQFASLMSQLGAMAADFFSKQQASQPDPTHVKETQAGSFGGCTSCHHTPTKEEILNDFDVAHNFLMDRAFRGLAIALESGAPIDNNIAILLDTLYKIMDGCYDQLRDNKEKIINEVIYLMENPKYEAPEHREWLSKAIDRLLPFVLKSRMFFLQMLQEIHPPKEKEEAKEE